MASAKIIFGRVVEMSDFFTQLKELGYECTPSEGTENVLNRVGDVFVHLASLCASVEVGGKRNDNDAVNHAVKILEDTLNMDISSSVVSGDRNIMWQQLCSIVHRIWELREQAAGVIRGQKNTVDIQETLTLTPYERECQNVRSVSIEVVRCAARIRTLMCVDGVSELLNDPSENRIAAVVEVETAQLQTLEAEVGLLQSDLLSLNEKIQLKKAELDRTVRRLEELKCQSRLEDNDESLVELRAVYQGYVTKLQNVEFVNYELQKLRDSRWLIKHTI